MAGTLITLTFVLGVVGLFLPIIRRIRPEGDAALEISLSGALGLGAIGTLLLFLGLMPGGVQIGLVVASLASAFGLVRLFGLGKSLAFRKPEGADALFLIPLVVASLWGLLGVLAPSDTLDWDSLAYHLAVPKLWLSANQIQPIGFIHHSNFPFAVDNLHLLGLWWGGEHGAKAFQWSFYLLAMLGAFGFARSRYGDRAGWWAALAFGTIPVAIWEAGTAYIDVANGLFGGLGLLLLADWLQEKNRGDLWLGAAMLGLCAGSKFTGLQLIACGGLALLLISGKQAPKTLVAGLPALILAVLIGSPWLAKNAVWTGNPVYPFFFEKLGGKGWDQRRADIYKNEQQTFGVGRFGEDPNYTSNPLSPTRFGHALFGLSYQPGRYVNPAQTVGGGSPMGAVGIAGFAGLLAWMFAGRGRSRRREDVVIAAVLLNMGLWFFLSQQSRYLLALWFPLCVLAGGAAVKLKAGKVVAGAVAVQALAALVLHYQGRAVAQLEVVGGKVSAEDYRKATVAFAEPAREINTTVPKDGKVALYDEVFGFLLDVPYVWANPGHSTAIPYDDWETAEEFVAGMKSLGFTHLYVNWSPMVKSQEFVAEMGATANLAPGEPISAERRQQLMEDWQQRFNVLIAESIREGRLSMAKTFRNSFLLELAQP